MNNNDIQLLSQNDIDYLDELGAYYDFEVLLPPVEGKNHIGLDTNDLDSLTLMALYESLFIWGFSFEQRKSDNRSYTKISGVYHADVV
jgi:hypothetical protein